MSSNSSPLIPLVLAALTAIAVAVGINKLGDGTRIAQQSEAPAPVKSRWSATAQGRVEPKGGEVRLSALSAGRIETVLVKANDKVRAGDLLVRIEDVDANARVMGADAEAGVRKRERDGETGVPRLAQDRRNAEDRLNTTERAVAVARQELDRLMLGRHAAAGSVTADQIAAQHKVLDEASGRLEADRQAFRQSQLAVGVPLPTRLEAGLTASRSDLSLAEAALERTRLRAPFDATILQVSAAVGELAAATPDQTLVVVGDMSGLRVRAEVEERDVAKVAINQEVMVRTDGYVGREFRGRVSSISQAMRPPKLAQRGPRRPNDIDTLEVMVDLEPGSPLLPGMRVDVYFVAAAASAPAAEPTKPAASIQPPAAPAPTAGSSSSASAAGAPSPQVLPPLQDAQPKSN